MHQLLLSHPSVVKHSGYSFNSAVVSDAAVNVGMQASLGYVDIQYYLGKGLSPKS